MGYRFFGPDYPGQRTVDIADGVPEEKAAERAGEGCALLSPPAHAFIEDRDPVGTLDERSQYLHRQHGVHTGLDLPVDGKDVAGSSFLRGLRSDERPVVQNVTER